MPKKRTRARRAAGQLPQAVQLAHLRAREAATAQPVAPKSVEAQAPGPGEDYSYLYSDLKRIAIIAGAMFSLLVVLSFIIR